MDKQQVYWQPPESSKHSKQSLVAHFTLVPQRPDQKHNILYPNYKSPSYREFSLSNYDGNNFRHIHHRKAQCFFEDQWRIVYQMEIHWPKPQILLGQIRIYGSFNEQDKFVPCEMRILNGKLTNNVEQILREQRLIPKAVMIASDQP